MSSGNNILNRYEFYVLDDDEKPVEVTEDTKIPNAATFKIIKQDHTLANMLRFEILADSNTLFAGYSAPHPLQPHVLLKVQTDGTITPREAVENAARRLIGMLTTLEAKFKREFAYNKDTDAAGTTGGRGAGDSTGGMGMGGIDAYGTAGAGIGSGTDGGAWSSKDYLDF